MEIIVMLVWLGLGALIGIDAASKRGMNPAAGAIGGALLGLLSPLLYLVDERCKADRKIKPCPFCGVALASAAIACPHCKRSLSTGQVVL